MFPLAISAGRIILENMESEPTPLDPAAPRLDVRKLVPSKMTLVALMRAVGRKSYPSFHNVLSGRDVCPPELAILIHTETRGAVPKYALRPDIWVPTVAQALRIEELTGGDLPAFLLRPELAPRPFVSGRGADRRGLSRREPHNDKVPA